MTVQEVKEKLNSVRTAYKEYTLARDKALHYRSALIGAVQTAPDVPQPHNGSNGTEEKIIRLIECTDKANLKFHEYILLRLEIEKMISQLNYPDEREILTRRYILNQKWDIIAAGTNYSIRHVTRLHGYALTHLICP